jgi:chemotaxis protein MotB
MNEDNWDIEELEEDESTAWITTFADISMLLLVFFILLFSMSSLNDEKFLKSIHSVRQALGGKSVIPSSVMIETGNEGVLVNEVTKFRQLIKAQQKVFADLQYYYTQKGLEGIVGAYLESGKITLRLPASVLFDSGKVELKPEGKKVLQEMKDFFIRHPDQKINIRGYTDNLPPRAGSRFKDNWEISALRAINVLRYLISIGIEPERLTATGFADLNPLYPNNSDENRARNRRVEFVLEKMIGG